jgi:signal transduction histidine kinase
MQRRWIVWLLVLAGWTALAIFFGVSSSLTYVTTNRPPQWRFTFLMALTEWYAWAALTPAVAWLATRLPLRPGRLLSSLPIHAVAGFFIAVVKVTLTRILRVSLVGSAAYFVISNLATHYVIYWALVAAVHALAYYRAGREGELRASQLEARLAETRLQLLKMQIHPHFLFNTLNTIAELVHEDPSKAERMIASLSELLRETLDAGATDRVPLEQELDLLERYVDIQRTRFGNRLDVRVHADADVRRALVPHLILQPLVENSIRHGLAARLTAGRIDVRATRRGDALRLEVEDDGTGLASEARAREGVGLGNMRARLQELYGAHHTVEIRNADAGGALVRLVIPWDQDSDNGERKGAGRRGPREWSEQGVRGKRPRDSITRGGDIPPDQ